MGRNETENRRGCGVTRKLEKLETTNKIYRTCRSCQSLEPVTIDSEAAKIKLCDTCFQQLQEERILNV